MKNQSFIPTAEQVRIICTHAESRGGAVSVYWESDRHSWRITATRRVRDHFKEFFIGRVSFENGEIHTTFGITKAQKLHENFGAMKRGEVVLTAYQEAIKKHCGDGEVTE